MLDGEDAIFELLRRRAGRREPTLPLSEELLVALKAIERGISQFTHSVGPWRRPCRGSR